MQFKEVKTASDIEKSAALAKEIWTEYYTDLLPKGQAAYMIEKFQSTSAMAKQIKEGHNYYLILQENQEMGYLDFIMKGDECFISKIYLLKNARGKGLGKEALNFIESKAKVHRASKLGLTVNKYNSQAINAYLRADFQNVGPVQFDIGNGYIMDDYKMEKQL